MLAVAKQLLWEWVLVEHSPFQDPPFLLLLNILTVVPHFALFFLVPSVCSHLLPGPKILFPCLRNWPFHLLIVLVSEKDEFC